MRPHQNDQQPDRPRRGGRGPWERGRGPAEPVAAPVNEVQGWLAGRLPATWFITAPELAIDRDEITIIGTLDLSDIPADVDAESAAEGRIKRFREETREERIAIASDLERTYERAVSWGAQAGDVRALFTHQATPAMTRLRQPERQVLDTLVDAGVARSRAEALAWCVKLVGQHEGEWINSLREALNSVQEVRQAGPSFAPLNAACKVPQR